MALTPLAEIVRRTSQIDDDPEKRQQAGFSSLKMPSPQVAFSAGVAAGAALVAGISAALKKTPEEQRKPEEEARRLAEEKERRQKEEQARLIKEAEQTKQQAVNPAVKDFDPAALRGLSADELKARLRDLYFKGQQSSDKETSA
jgi:hypothetical protein